MYVKELEEDEVNLFNPFDVSYTMLKLRYTTYDDALTQMDFIGSHDKINLFINLESVYKWLSQITDLERRVYGNPSVAIDLISNSINLAAHYMKFFKGARLDTKIFLYQTDFLSDKFHEMKINEDFRSYYLNKYNTNPKYCILTDILKEKVFPELTIITNFIPNIYFINSHNIEGSLVPLIIGEKSRDRKNLIISSENYDSQYTYFPTFRSSIIKRRPREVHEYHDPAGFIKMLDNNRKEDSEMYAELFDTYGMYCTLLATMGDKYRSIDGLKGIGTVTLSKMINDNLKKNLITKNSVSPEILGNIFESGGHKEEFESNYLCTNLVDMFKSLSYTDKESILNQIIDRSDTNSLYTLNSTRFRDHPMLLEIVL